MTAVVTTRWLVIGSLVLATIGPAIAGSHIRSLPVEELKLMDEPELLAEAVRVCQRAVTIWPRTPKMSLEIRAEAVEYLERIGRVYRTKAGVWPAWQRELAELVLTELAHAGTVTVERCTAVQVKP